MLLLLLLLLLHTCSWAVLCARLLQLWDLTIWLLLLLLLPLLGHMCRDVCL
jgi:hypothetical protein